MTEFAVSSSLAVVTGIASSYLFWIWLTKGLAPKVVWSSSISKARLPGGPVKYRVKIMNAGRRAAVDFSAVCLLKLPDAGSNGNTKLATLRTLDVPLPKLSPGRSRVITIKTDGIDPLQVRGLPAAVRECLNQDPPIPLEQLLARFPGAHLVLHLSAYDEKSGTRCHFTSQDYTTRSITDRPFVGDGVDIQARGLT
ncbi:hypothetical protein ACWCQK_33375 [Streptomyces sp. NPDC002306]